MDPNELIKAAPELTKAVATLVAGLPFGDIVKRICGPPADLLGDKLKERVERCFDKTTRMIQDGGFTPQAVPPKLLFPILQGASLEEDENLHDMWAALLANAASLENAAKVRPGFIAILRQMAPDEAKLLKGIAEITDEQHALLRPFAPTYQGATDRHTAAAYNAVKMKRLQEDFCIPGEEVAFDGRFQTCVQILEIAGLIKVGEIVTLSALGSTFLAACRAPQPKS